MSVEREVKSPKYRHVFNQLRKEIVTGKYKPGQKFPSEADLVKRFDASRITVGRAVRELSQQNLVERRAGSGTYVRSDRSQGLSFGLLIPDLGRTEIFEPICQGMADAPQAAEHALLWGNAASGNATATRQERALQLCEQYVSRKVSGVFFAPLERLAVDDPTNQRIIDALQKARIPVVLLDRDFLPYPQRSRHDLIGIDNRRTGYIVTEHLLGLGSRRIAFLSYPRSPSTVEERIAGYREALFVHGIPVEPALVQRLESDENEAIRALIEAVHPDAFVCANDRTAGRLMQSLLALGHQIPSGMRVVGIDDVEYAGLLPVPLTTMHQPCREIGMAAMAAMLERLARPDMPVRDVLLECALVIRDSCGGKDAATTGVDRATARSRP
ncbi:MAG: GntR family transcriptional regulator [Chthoniobacteraceae bacterium]|nr:GntR family transcriptional regulator [Chthoniobacteraceae bacterium]